MQEKKQTNIEPQFLVTTPSHKKVPPFFLNQKKLVLLQFKLINAWSFKKNIRWIKKLACQGHHAIYKQFDFLPKDCYFSPGDSLYQI